MALIHIYIYKTSQDIRSIASRACDLTRMGFQHGTHLDILKDPFFCKKKLYLIRTMYTSAY